MFLRPKVGITTTAVGVTRTIGIVSGAVVDAVDAVVVGFVGVAVVGCVIASYS